ncbi:hypothetical protein AAC387_Pa08g1219 [Persea americana]
MKRNQKAVVPAEIRQPEFPGSLATMGPATLGHGHRRPWDFCYWLDSSEENLSRSRANQGTKSSIFGKTEDFVADFPPRVETRSVDLTHLWCLVLDLDPAGDAIHEAPVAGDYGWGPADQVIEPEDGVHAPGV